MRYLLTIILGLFLWTGCNDDDETLVPSTEPEFRYVLPQGNHDYDTKIVNWYEDCGFYILYKYEDKDVFYNENMPWAGFVQDTLRINVTLYFIIVVWLLSYRMKNTWENSWNG